MAVTIFKTFIAGEVLTASDLNDSLNKVFDNGEDLGWPATKARSMAGNQLTMDADGDSGFVSDTDDRMDIKLKGTDLFRFNGSTGTPVNGIDFVTGISGTATHLIAQSATDTNINIEIRSAGTGDVILADDSGNQILIAADVASAVNEITITNAATGNEPSIAATGGDTDISIELTPKGAGILDLTLGPLNGNKGADIASGATTDIGAATGNYLDVTGTTTITAFGTVKAGTQRILQFDGALILTHNATSLILFGAANITTAAGDVAHFVSLGSGNWQMTSFSVAASSVAAATQAEMETATSTTVTTTPGRQHFHPGHPKAWAMVRTDGQTSGDYAVTSIGDDGTGQFTVTWTTAFSDANYSTVGTAETAVPTSAALALIVTVTNAKLAGTAQFNISSADDGAAVDPNFTLISAFGDT